ncbi:MAG: ribonuclease P protein component [Flavobacteriales bacterium]
MNYRFPKSEKLKSRKAIELLFQQGKTITKHPLKVIFLKTPLAEQSKAAFAVPKRNFKKAVDRNRVKRQLRESYRLHKHLLINEKQEIFMLFFLYIGKEKLPYQQIEKAMITILKKINI